MPEKRIFQSVSPDQVYWTAKKFRKRVLQIQPVQQTHLHVWLVLHQQINVVCSRQILESRAKNPQSLNPAPSAEFINLLERQLSQR